MEWINAGHKVAVVAVDPSSHLSGGSILGDKTRMERLSMNPNAYVRPCASGCVLGGLAQHTDEVVMLMEAAGYNMVLVETVGVGQSEVLVTEVADMCLLLLPPAGGDELQGIKRGIVEAADLVVVNKADGDLLMPAKRALVEYRSALHTARGGGRAQRPWWEGSAMLCSSVDGTGVANVAKEALKFKQTGEQAGELLKRRGDQRTTWMWRKAEQDLIEAFRAHAKGAAMFPGRSTRALTFTYDVCGICTTPRARFVKICHAPRRQRPSLSRVPQSRRWGPSWSRRCERATSRRASRPRRSSPSTSRRRSRACVCYEGPCVLAELAGASGTGPARGAGGSVVRCRVLAESADLS